MLVLVYINWIHDTKISVSPLSCYVKKRAYSEPTMELTVSPEKNRIGLPTWLMLWGTNLIKKKHHFAGMATKPLCLTPMNVMQGIDIRNPALHSWIPTNNSSCSQDVRTHWNQETRDTRPTVDTTYIIFGMADPSYPRQPGVLTERFPAFGFWAGLRDWKRHWGNEGPNKYTQIH